MEFIYLKYVTGAQNRGSELYVTYVIIDFGYTWLLSIILSGVWCGFPLVTCIPDIALDFKQSLTHLCQSNT